MRPKTENLCIVLTDIVGFTETTAHQSRVDNEKLLETHNRILLPIAKRFQGRLVKSIGDALLLVFKSPTDAMLCAMAMQDALFEYNRNISDDQQIHIRIAASLGEVRIAKNDIFGEPVNITSRIEGVTPKDEIYLSEAVYMAMNKAEVPCQEVGWKELKGISEAIRLFCIPRFSTPRLVPEDIMSSEDISDLVYPYGGAHLISGEISRDTRGFGGAAAASVSLLASPKLWAAVVGIPLAMGGGWFVAKQIKVMPEKQLIAEAAVSSPAAEPASESTTQKIEPTKPAEKKSEPVVAPKPEPVKPVVAKAAPRPKPVPETKPEPEKSEDKSALEYPTLSAAKRAYKRKEIDKEGYAKAVRAIKAEMKQEVKLVRQDLDEKKIDRKEYKRRITDIKKKYE